MNIKIWMKKTFRIYLKIKIYFHISWISIMNSLKFQARTYWNQILCVSIWGFYRNCSENWIEKFQLNFLTTIIWKKFLWTSARITSELLSTNFKSSTSELKRERKSNCFFSIGIHDTFPAGKWCKTIDITVLILSGR